MQAIVNVNEEWGIGRDGELLVNIPDDMKFFRNTTAGGVLIMGRKTLESFPGAKPLKGRVNIVLTREPSRIRQESIEAADEYLGDFRLLKLKHAEGTDTHISGQAVQAEDERLARFRTLCHQVILHRDAPIAERPTVLVTVDTAETAAALCREIGGDSVYVVGGASIYEQMLKHCDICLVTMNDSKNEPDTYFPNLDLLSEWECSARGETREHEGIHYHFDTYVRVSGGEHNIDNIHLSEIDSTNDYAKRLIEQHRRDGIELPDCTLISADRQSAGRGRCGKSFESPKGGSIYMTLILGLNKLPEHCMLITPAAAVGTLEALEAAGSKHLGIKWVNDLYLDEGKVCGILTEAVMDESGTKIEYAVVGIGVNIDADIASFPEEVRDIAATLTGLKNSKEEVIFSIAKQVTSKIYAAVQGDLSFMRIYRERSILTRKCVSWEDDRGRHSGRVLGINDSGSLEVDEDGKKTVLQSGEVSVNTFIGT